ncbi:NAD(P)-binding protein [Saccharata proteae CBS 121410]|uniref:NAD(P)-binding protein n=1 Tax=Saccharata proteae CBS 121410 TaxID=1314787 RepID=A0A9P4I4L6_9PEZI|nr:NAD(P)-binding protein [Saccharata proteae CBS 121410]
MAGRRLEGKIALITGSSSGLGRSIALAYASEGAQICCVDLYPGLRNAVDASTGKADSFHNRISSGTSTADLLNAEHPSSHAVFVRADITQEVEVKRAVEACVHEFGRLDIMVNNAGISVESTHPRPFRCHETTESDYDKTMAINAKGVFLGAKFALAQMLKQDPVPGDRGDKGWVVNIASVQGLLAYKGTPAYAASKGAVVALTRQLALDYAPERIHVNSLCPGFLRTAMTQNIQNDAETLRVINDAHPFGGMGDVEDVARAAVFLASDDARWVTGVPLPVDGGYSCQ